MPTELDDLLSRTDAAIAKLRDELRLEERVRERILECGSRQPTAAPNPKTEGDAQTADNSGGHRPACSLIEGSLASRIIGILRAAERPMKAKEITVKVSEQGFTTNAKAGLKGSVASQLSRGRKAGRFVLKGRGRYAMKSESPEEAV